MADVLAGRRLVAEDGVPAVTRSFPREPASVRDARRFTRAALEDWALTGLADTAELVVSELAANAVRHARRDSYRVTLRRLAPDRVQVAVIDLSRAEPQVARAGEDSENGRGLALVDAVSTRWGTEPLRWGKRVWADLTLPAAPEAPVPEVPIFHSARGQIVYVLVLIAAAAALYGGVATRT
ncbi:ATP-binding protein [Streptomyces sp. NPDC086091]|uniref:ATP-binding protein n=1 Tax=Streptomyces sp. NPDC086091 TaxID=3365751 RepID=UPI0038109584